MKKCYFYEIYRKTPDVKPKIQMSVGENEKEALENASFFKQPDAYQYAKIKHVCTMTEREYQFFVDFIMHELEDPYFRYHIVIEGETENIGMDLHQRLERYLEKIDSEGRYDWTAIWYYMKNEKYKKVIEYIENECREGFQRMKGLKYIEEDVL